MFPGSPLSAAKIACSARRNSRPSIGPDTCVRTPPVADVFSAMWFFPTENGVSETLSKIGEVFNNDQCCVPFAIPYQNV